MENSTILVPLKIEALIVGETTANSLKYQDLTIKYFTVGNMVSNEMEADLFRETNGIIESGIHLHWVLPAALRHGVSHGDEVEYPPVPNRWLIIRTQNVHGKLKHKEWIVESDFIGESGTSPWVAQNDKGFIEATKIGRFVDFNDWETESNTPNEKLTAIGPGNTAFAAYYGSCRNVFGFHDPMDDVDDGTFSYMVSGWYSKEEDDPLYAHDPIDTVEPNNTSTPKKLTLRQKRFLDIKSKWKLAKELKDFPQITLCHCAIHSLIWKKNGNYSNKILTTAVNIDVGNTAVEAMSSRIARQTGAAEKLLSAFQLDLLKDASGLVEIQDEVHARQFLDMPGGSLWEIQRTETNEQIIPKAAVPGKDDEIGLNKKPDFPDGSVKELSDLVNNFSELNSAQRELDSLKRIKHSLQLEFRATWDKIKLAELEGLDIVEFLTEKKNNLKDEIGKAMNSIRSFEEKIKTHISFIQNLRFFKEIKNTDPSNTPPEYKLIETQMPRFWKPKNSSLLFSGPGVKSSDKYSASDKYKNEGEFGALDCRLSDEVITGICLIDGLEQKTIQIGAFPLQPKCSFKGEISKTVAKIYLESLLLDPAWSRDVAHEYFIQNNRLTVNRNAPLVEDLRAVILKLLDGRNEDPDIQNKIKGFVRGNTTCTLPAITSVEKNQFFNDLAIHTWNEPWTPLFLLWDMEWYPSYNKGDDKTWNYNSDSWKFSDAYDYTYENKTNPKEKTEFNFKGKTFLSDSTSQQLKVRLKDFKKLSKLNFMSQALDGMNDCLIMREQGIQLPLLGYPDGENLTIVEPNNPNITHQQYFLPNINKDSGFFPIRAGHIKMHKLWVVDSFGQTQKIGLNGNLKVSKELANEDSDLITLPPRIIQPSRLMFRWIAGDKAKENQETDSNPATSPICGWIMPNYLDKSLMVFDNAGKVLGVLRADLTEALRWNSIGEKKLTPDAIINYELREFIKGFLTEGNEKAKKERLDQMLKLIDAVSDSISAVGSKIDPGVAILMGQPLALVRASLQLELFGLPAFPQGFRDGWTNRQTAQKPTGLEGYKFPVYLGDNRKYKDGLIGFFKETRDSDAKIHGDIKLDYSKMYTCFGTQKNDRKNENNNNYFNDQDLQLSFTEEADLRIVSMLLDVRAGVNASTGILPTKYIEIPSNLITNAMDSMEMDFLIAPLIGNQEKPAIPLAKVPGKEWTWTAPKTRGTLTKTDKEVADRSVMPKNDFASQQILEGYLSLKIKKPKDSTTDS